MSKLVVTQELIEKINELYLEKKTYAGVSRALGGSPSPTTVKKYIISNYVSAKDIKITPFDKTKISSKIDFTLFKNKQDWGELCLLTAKEESEIKELQKELSI